MNNHIGDVLLKTIWIGCYSYSRIGTTGTPGQHNIIRRMSSFQHLSMEFVKCIDKRIRSLQATAGRRYKIGFPALVDKLTGTLFHADIDTIS